MKITTKRVLSAALMAALGIAGSAAASDGSDAKGGEKVGDNPYPPDPNTEELWWQDTGFLTPYKQTLDVTDPTTGVVTPKPFDLGINIVEVISYVVDPENPGTYYLTLHPEYFGPTTLPYDDQYTAQYAMELQGLLVWNNDPENGAYVNCFYDGFPKFPDTYLFWNAANGYYAKCIVTSSIEEIKTGKIIPANWNGREVYFEIPEDVWPSAPNPVSK
ncbi:MAG: hypothetical protein LBD85_04780 [Oscillospiraceae bacterium]|jgi:hypothetical protein|nr:hypothetical protein [Oscillospiraceae bacterium]